ncbi:MAG: maturase [Chloroflexales bacterium]|nr:maturase [Chloroflexales bacterium]
MRTAETILHVIRDRGRRRLPLERVYRLLFSRELFLLAYGRIYRNAGAMTPGSTPETADGMSLRKIDTIITQLRAERYRWTPVRRTYIPKKRSTKLRPLGLPSWSDKLLQEVIRLILEAYFEPQFSSASHGFRPGRGCHTALREIYHSWTGTAWFIEGDIQACFDSLDHSVLDAMLAEHIHDNRFLRLLRELLRAGYLEAWTYHRTLSGAPQGSIVGPILSNIYLSRFDQFVETQLIPQYTRGTRRRPNPAYERISHRAGYLARTGRMAEAKALRKQRRGMPSIDPYDPAYRRLRYIRYADDFLLGFCGPREEAEYIKQQLRQFLHETLKLKLSEPKTLLTHARTTPARFLGYAIHVIQDDQLCDATGRRATNGTIGLKLPVDVVQAACQRYMRHGKPIQRTQNIFDSDFSIIAQYQQEFRGFVEYYRLAYNLAAQGTWFKHVMEQSLTKTLAAKYRISVPAVYRRYGAMLETPQGPRKGLQVSIPRDEKPPLVAQWGGISLARCVEAVHDDRPKPVWNARTELSTRLLAQRCELCGATDNIVVHHIRHLKDLKGKGRGPRPAWVEKMAARRRKTLVVCETCHHAIHAGQADGNQARTPNTGEPDA